MFVSRKNLLENKEIFLSNFILYFLCLLCIFYAYYAYFNIVKKMVYGGQVPWVACLIVQHYNLILY